MHPAEAAAALRLLYRQTSDGSGWAIFSQGVPDDVPGRHRYALGRIWSEPIRRTLVVCGLNPSKATEEVVDNTIAWLIRLATRDGFNAFVMLNAFALRSTDPHGLVESDDPLGTANDAVIHWALSELGDITAVAAWGKPKWKVLEHRIGTVERMHKWKCFALTQCGRYPRHPLYLPNATKICDWK